MTLIPVHHNISSPVTSWGEIKKIAYELRDLASGTFSGEHKECYALHHAQVSDAPLNFFCLSKKGEEILKFPSWCIINPEIVRGSHPFRPSEGCMSWPHRKMQKVDRMRIVLVHFKYPVFGYFGTTLQEFTGELFELEAHVFQHETDHGRGKTIHD